MCTGGGWKGPKPDLPTFQPSNWHFPLHFRSRRSWKVPFRLSPDRPSNLPTHFPHSGGSTPGSWKVGRFALARLKRGPSNFPRRKMKGKAPVGRLEGWKVWFSTPSPPPLCTRLPFWQKCEFNRQSRDGMGGLPIPRGGVALCACCLCVPLLFVLD